MFRWIKRLIRGQQKPVLICMRLAEMQLVHPDQTTDICSQCGEVVGVYPSGQAVIADIPDITILCNYCQPSGGTFALAPGAEHEPFQSRWRR